MTTSAFTPTLPIGYGVVVPGSSDGLVSSSGVPGRTNGVAIPAGYVGETSFQSSTTTTGSTTVGTYTNITGTDITLGAGIWLITCHASVVASTASGGSVVEEISIYNSTDASTLSASLGGYAGTSSQATVQTISQQNIVTLSASKTYRLRHRSVTFGGTPTISSGATIYGTFSSTVQTKISYVRLA